MSGLDLPGLDLPDSICAGSICPDSICPDSTCPESKLDLPGLDLPGPDLPGLNRLALALQASMQRAARPYEGTSCAPPITNEGVQKSPEELDSNRFESRLLGQGGLDLPDSIFSN